MSNEYDKSVYTTCTRDCPDNCGVIARVKEGRVVRLDGHPEHEFTRGFLCPKASKFVERVYSPDRQLYPLKRQNGRIDGEWERISWDEALDLVAQNICRFVEKDGPLSIMHYQRSASWGILKTYNRRFWNLLGGVTTNSGSLCAGAARAGQAADFGKRLGHDTSDFYNSKYLVFWGRNPSDTSVHFIPIIKEVQKNGGRVVVVDPLRTNTAAISDLHIQPRIGTDGELAMAMAKVILKEGLQDDGFIRNNTYGFKEYCSMLEGYSFEELCDSCGISQNDVRAFARDYATIKPAAIVFGWGLNRHCHSAKMFRCVDALAALCGNIGVSGGGASHGYDTKRHVDKSIEAADRAVNKRNILEPLMGRGLIELKDPAIRMMVTNGVNPVNTSPNSRLVAKAMSQLEFVVVMDLFLNDTSDYAHIFLPVTTYLEDEFDAVISWGHNILGGVNRAIAPRGEARSDFWIYQQLSKRVGLEKEMAGSEHEWISRLLAPLEKTGIKVDDLFTKPIRCPVAPMVPFKDNVFPTASGKFEFITDMSYKKRNVPGYPLVLLTPLSKGWIVAELTEAQHPKEITASINQETAQKYEIKNGEQVLLCSPIGKLKVKAVIDNAIGHDIVMMPFGTWIKKGGGPNVLIEDIMTESGETAAYHEGRVRLEKI